jgi:hypothetical protein
MSGCSLQPIVGRFELTLQGTPDRTGSAWSAMMRCKAKNYAGLLGLGRGLDKPRVLGAYRRSHRALAAKWDLEGGLGIDSDAGSRLAVNRSLLGHRVRELAETHRWDCADGAGRLLSRAPANHTGRGLPRSFQRYHAVLTVKACARARRPCSQARWRAPLTAAPRREGEGDAGKPACAT